MGIWMISSRFPHPRIERRFHAISCLVKTRHLLEVSASVRMSRWPRTAKFKMCSKISSGTVRMNDFVIFSNPLDMVGQFKLSELSSLHALGGNMSTTRGLEKNLPSDPVEKQELCVDLKREII